ncbi:MAG: pyrroline-5-carboxylate reductase [Myxococcota bacterium]|jgi:pyrroline-5-carboxylate reductase|nr:pyrroline-5-carboxylate reductase [Deltaproteobacteria bacterium]MCP4239121.1 pyrroline-5-carboxylate reductase [bacterium]MDP6074630.1 pyrroline-5-carboxylate reductase [Myxococcota bacterium]MDP6241984.1 pyrroline-5-carboxylate reductase [Myxococcota bacterium]MDP7072966.1 pyrroline-5-carboxylate reductase [Myxococcota bacterium]
MSLKDARIGFVGGGAMAEALLAGLLAAGVAPKRLRAADPEATRREHLATRLGIETTGSNSEAVADADAVVLAVKPDVVQAVLDALRASGADIDRPVWISIAAGVTLTTLERGLGEAARVVRAMPNTPALVGEGATGLCSNAGAAVRDVALAVALFESVGSVWQAPNEALLDAVTGLSGSGPAYVFAFLEALIAAGEAQGLPREACEVLAFQTVYGAAKLARESEHNPAELRRQVSSPGGTTLAGLRALEDRGFAEAIAEAVGAATRRASELGQRN